MIDSNSLGIAEANKPSRKNPEVKWSESLEGVLVASVQKRKAFMRTKDMTLDAKWTLVHSDCFQHPLFVNHKNFLTVESCKKKFKRMRDAISSKYALEEEGANLSGLKSDVSSTEKSIYNMVQEELKVSQEKIELSEKKANRNSLMLHHESIILKKCNETASTTSYDNLGENDGEDRYSPSFTTSSTSSAGRYKKMKIEDDHEHFMNLEIRRMEMAERKMALEERKIALEEKKLALLEQNKTNTC